MLETEYARNYAFEADYWWFVGRRALVMPALLPGLRGTGRRILDVGCGTGYNLEYLSSRAEAYGVDVSPDALAFCRGRGLRRLALAEAESLPYAAGTFDVLTALDVLEHLDDDGVALREWWRALRPGGRLVLFVPAFDFLWSGEDFVSRHKRRYRKDELAQAVAGAGFQIRKLTYANALLLPAVMGTILVNRLFRPRSLYESNLKPLPGPLNRLLAAVFTFEARLLARWNASAGSSLFCVAEKPTEGREDG